MKRESRGKRPSFYDVPGLDQMMSMIMVLASEVSVITDHVDMLERALALKGIDVAAAIGEVKLDQDALEAREGRRQAFLDRLFYLMRKEAAEAEARETGEGYARVIDETAQG